MPSNITQKKHKRLFVSACEPSSNVHLKHLAKHLDKDLEICGVFDRETFIDFEKATPSFTLKDFAVMGFFDVIKKIAFFKKAIAQMSELAKSADCVLLMDSSSFNLPIAKAVKRSGIKVPIVYYILPQVWAWKPWRAKSIEQNCDYLCGILPFELEMYKNALAQKRALYVGHPLMDEITEFKSEVLPYKTAPIAFMPGSRKSEIKRIFPIFAEAAKSLPNRKILILPEHFKKLDSQALNEIYGDEIKAFDISFEANKALLESGFAFICSGTATLQATLIGTPLVLGYKTRGIEVLIARAFIKLKHIGLANILYNALYSNAPHSKMRDDTQQIHTELIQSQLTAENLLKAFEEMDIESFSTKSQELRDYLKHGSAKQVAGILNEILDKQ